MKGASTTTYLLELNVKKCRINITEKGSIGLLLRAGRSQSGVSQFKPLKSGVVDFDTQIRLNVDQSALDTQRCSLTLNFVSSENSKKVVGIVVINLPEVGEQITKAYKVTSTPDKDASIDINIAIRELDQNRRPVKLQRQLSNSNINKSTLGELALLTSSNRKNQEKPTSPPSDSTNKLKLKSKVSELNHSEELEARILKLERENGLLKKLLKLETAKSKTAQQHLSAILQTAASSADALKFTPSETILKAAFSNDFSTPLKKLESEKISSNPMIALGGQPLSVVKESRPDETEQSVSGAPNPKGSRVQSNILQMRSQVTSGSEMGSTLKEFKKLFEDSFKSRKEVKQMFDRIKSEPHIEVDAVKLKTVKNKIDKTYVGMLGKTTCSKDDIFKHKTEIAKIFDELLAAK